MLGLLVLCGRIFRPWGFPLGFSRASPEKGRFASTSFGPLSKEKCAFILVFCKSPFTRTEDGKLGRHSLRYQKFALNNGLRFTPAIIPVSFCRFLISPRQAITARENGLLAAKHQNESTKHFSFPHSPTELETKSPQNCWLASANPD